MNRKTGVPRAMLAAEEWLKPMLGSVLFFFAVCLCSPGSVRVAAVLFTILVLSSEKKSGISIRGGFGKNAFGIWDTGSC